MKNNKIYLIILIFSLILILQFLFFYNRYTKKIISLISVNNVLSEKNEDYINAFTFNCKMEGKEINPDIIFKNIRNSELLNLYEFLNKYSCVLMLSEIGCNECYIKEFQVLRDVIPNYNNRKKIAVLSNTTEKSFLIRLTKDYANDFDVFQFKDQFFKESVKVDAPFFFQINSDAKSYNVNLSIKDNQKLTSIYARNLEFK